MSRYKVYLIHFCIKKQQNEFLPEKINILLAICLKQIIFERQWHGSKKNGINRDNRKQ